MKGKVNFYKAEKGYGFVRNEQAEDFFFHISDYSGKDGDIPKVGECVSFDVVNTSKGARAVNVTVIE